MLRLPLVLVRADLLSDPSDGRRHSPLARENQLVVHLNAGLKYREDPIDAIKAKSFEPSGQHLGDMRAFAAGLPSQLGLAHSRLRHPISHERYSCRLDRSHIWRGCRHRPLPGGEVIAAAIA